MGHRTLPSARQSSTLLVRERWKLLSAVVRGRRVRRSIQERLQVSASALLYPNLAPPNLTPNLTVRTRMQGGVGAGGETPPATRLGKTVECPLFSFRAEQDTFLLQFSIFISVVYKDPAHRP